MHFEDTGNSPVVISWISREHELYSGASPIPFIEHCVTFRHDRRLLLLLGFVHNWPTSSWSGTKKENQFLLNGNGIMSSFLGWQFYHYTLYVLYIYIYRSHSKIYLQDTLRIFFSCVMIWKKYHKIQSRLQYWYKWILELKLWLLLEMIITINF